MPKVWNCPLCEWFGAVSMKAVVRHIGAVHAHNAGFHICCGIAGCPRTYSKFASYRQHLYRVHREVLDIDTSEPSVLEDDDCDLHSNELLMEDSPSGSDTNFPSHSENSFPLSMKQVGLFLLKAKDVYKVAESHLGPLIDDISSMIELTVNHLEERVRLQLDSMGLGMSSEMKTLFRSPQLTSVFDRLHTKSRLQNFVQENLELVVSFNWILWCCKC